MSSSKTLYLKKLRPNNQKWECELASELGITERMEEYETDGELR